MLVHLDGEKGEATFHGDSRLGLYPDSGRATLTGHVTGHVILAPQDLL